jgi:hypothetical protein
VTRAHISDIAFAGFMAAWLTAGAALLFARWVALAVALGFVVAFWVVGRLAVARLPEAPGCPECGWPIPGDDCPVCEIEPRP